MRLHLEDMLQHMPIMDVVSVLLLSAMRQHPHRKVCIEGVNLIIRPGTSDLRVAFSSLVHGEYNDIELDDAAVIIDAGANIGTSAIAFSKRYPNAMIIAIEPETSNFTLLEENARLWSNIWPVKAALTARDGERLLLDRGTGPWGYTVTDSQQTIGELGQEVRCVTVTGVLDQFDITSIDILKLDIEGGEKEVLESADEWIERVRVLVAELHDGIIPGCEDAFRRATQLFKEKSVFGEKVVAYR
ncbi:FkbM family methyltransferase [Gemmatimonadota bacterium]